MKIVKSKASNSELEKVEKVKKSKVMSDKKAKPPKLIAVKKDKNQPKVKKPKVKSYTISGKFKADAEGNVVKKSKNLIVEYVKKMTGTGKPGFMVKVAVNSK